MEVALDEIVWNLYEESWSPKFIEGQRWVECACQKTLDRNIEDTFCCNRTKNRRIINSKTFDSKNVIIWEKSCQTFTNSDVFSFAWISFSITFSNMGIYHLLLYQHTYRHTINCNFRGYFYPILTFNVTSNASTIWLNLNQGIVAQLY